MSSSTAAADDGNHVISSAKIVAYNMQADAWLVWCLSIYMDAVTTPVLDIYSLLYGPPTLRLSRAH